MKINLNNFGKKLKFHKRAKTTKSFSEQELFIDTLEKLERCWEKSNKAYELFGINLLEYEEDYFRSVENLFAMKYGTWKTEIILWYVFGRMTSDGEILPLKVQVDGKDVRELILTKPSQLWDFLIELENDKL